MTEFFPIGDDGLRIEVLLPYAPERVFRAWSRLDEFSTWFRGSEDGYLEVQDFDFREGGGFEVTMISGSGYRATLTGTYLEIEKNSRLRFTWAWRTAEGLSPQMIVEIEFLRDSTGTRMVIQHEPFMSSEDRDNHRSGWTPCLNNLRSYLNQAV